MGSDGENWSVGQRQLFCFGRALLRKSRILVLDEAATSIDDATYVILQTIIRKEFAGCTVITVAHMIHIVIDSDMVVAISDGKALSLYLIYVLYAWIGFEFQLNLLYSRKWMVMKVDQFTCT